MKAKYDTLMSIVRNIMAIFYCFCSGNHLDQVLTNTIYLGQNGQVRDTVPGLA